MLPWQLLKNDKKWGKFKQVLIIDLCSMMGTFTLLLNYNKKLGNIRLSPKKKVVN
jgi:hypothetical protein